MKESFQQEPPTSGKVVLHTTYGDLEIELWCKETPRTCQNFIQLCMENYYNETIFHRVIKEFMVQGGDPTGTGKGGESVWGRTFADQFHSRLGFSRRGIVGMANSGPGTNGSQFFITLDKASYLNQKNTVFGKIEGNTIYNLLNMGIVEVDGNDRPYYPPKIKTTEIIKNPFENIIPRDIIHPWSVVKEEPKKSESKFKKRGAKKLIPRKPLKSKLGIGDSFLQEDWGQQKPVVKKLVISSHDAKVNPKMVGEVHESTKELEAIRKEKAELQKKQQEFKERILRGSEKIDQEESVKDVQLTREELRAIEAIRETESKTQEVKKREYKRQVKEYQSDEDISSEDEKKKKVEESRKKVRAELLKFKEYQIGSVLDDLMDSENKPTALALQREKYLKMKKMSKTVQNEVSGTQKQTMSKLRKFQRKLHSKETDGWMKSKLSFHVTADRAFHITNTIKENEQISELAKIREKEEKQLKWKAAQDHQAKRKAGLLEEEAEKKENTETMDKLFSMESLMEATKSKQNEE